MSWWLESNTKHEGIFESVFVFVCGPKTSHPLRCGRLFCLNFISLFIWWSRIWWSVIPSILPDDLRDTMSSWSWWQRSLEAFIAKIILNNFWDVASWWQRSLKTFIAKVVLDGVWNVPFWRQHSLQGVVAISMDDLWTSLASFWELHFLRNLLLPPGHRLKVVHIGRSLRFGSADFLMAAAIQRCLWVFACTFPTEAR